MCAKHHVLVHSQVEDDLPYPSFPAVPQSMLMSLVCISVPNDLWIFTCPTINIEFGGVKRVALHVMSGFGEKDKNHRVCLVHRQSSKENNFIWGARLICIGRITLLYTAVWKIKYHIANVPLVPHSILRSFVCILVSNDLWMFYMSNNQH